MSAVDVKWSVCGDDGVCDDGIVMMTRVYDPIYSSRDAYDRSSSRIGDGHDAWKTID